jgi:hypothetical protein
MFLAGHILVKKTTFKLKNDLGGPDESRKMYVAHSWDQFHQHSTRSFYVRKLPVQLFCAYILGLYFTGVSLPAQNLRVER